MFITVFTTARHWSVLNRVCPSHVLTPVSLIIFNIIFSSTQYLPNGLLSSGFITKKNTYAFFENVLHVSPIPFFFV
jgi:hypothetical protein